MSVVVPESRLIAGGRVKRRKRVSRAMELLALLSSVIVLRFVREEPIDLELAPI